MGSLLERELIKKDFDEKYPLIVKMIDKELDTAKSIYDEQMAAKKEGGKAVLHKNMPKVSGSLRWAQELRERITAPMGNFKALDHRWVFLYLHETFLSQQCFDVVFFMSRISIIIS